MVTMPRCGLIRAAIIAFGVLFLSALSNANVTLKNGNFFIGYIDIVYAGGYEPKLERVYNSKSGFKGFFGTGWGVEFESYMTISAEGSLAFHQYGGGKEEWFAPPDMSKDLLERSVEPIVEAAKKSNKVKNQDEESSYRAKLLTNRFTRVDEWQRFAKMGLVTPRKLPVGTILNTISTCTGYQTVEKLQQGYLRRTTSTKLEYYDEAGRLSKVEDKNGNYVLFERSEDGRIKTVKDNYGRSFDMFYTSSGLVDRIRGHKGEQAFYRYDDRDRLIYSKDTAGNVFEYAYDNRSNMTEIKYSDGSTLSITYHPREAFENVSMVKERDGISTSYEYKYSKQGNLDQTHVSTVMKDDRGNVLSKNFYIYSHKKDEFGNEMLVSLVENRDGERKVTEYNEFAMPKTITIGDSVTKFAYDDKCRCIRKETPSEITELQYDPLVGKVSYVKHQLKSKGSTATWSKFAYDEKGNLVRAQNSVGRDLELTYDSSGRIATMKAESKESIAFTYNSDSKPVVMDYVSADGKPGKLTVKYNEKREVEKVDSEGGAQISRRISALFQQLLDVIKPASITLTASY